jgi:release factor glutamine methyltransferase
MASNSTFREVLKRASSLLTKGDYNPKIAEWLMLHLLQIDRHEWLDTLNKTATNEEEGLYLGWIQDVLEGKPYQYITGVEEFYGREFRVSPAVLIPRPETELLVEHVTKLLRKTDQTSSRKKIGVDVGTGSGIIAITLALELGDSVEMLAVDISAEAIDIAKENAAYQSAKVHFMESDLLSTLHESQQMVDFIVSNPPYIPYTDISTLYKNVIDHEPHLALFAEEQGLWFYKEIVKQSRGILRSGGILAFEIGIHQEEPVVQLIRSVYPKAQCKIEKDYNAINRMVFAEIII